jgi:hypothetical protein
LIRHIAIDFRQIAINIDYATLAAGARPITLAGDTPLLLLFSPPLLLMLRYYYAAYSYGSSFALPPPRRRRDLLFCQRHYAAIIASTPFRRFLYALIIAIIFRHYVDIFATRQH